jgi:hypothetical protein
MPNDLSIQVAAPASTGSGGSAPAKPAATAAPLEQITPAPMTSPNPTLQLNAALGLVVIEFRNNAGTVISSIPTTQQLEAYRLWQESGTGPPPNLDAFVADAAPPPAPAASGGANQSSRSEVGG